MIVRELITFLGYKTDTKALASYSSGLAGLSKRFLGIGAAATAAFGTIYGFVKLTARAAEEIRTASDRLGVNAQELQKWRYAAELSNSSAGALDGAIRFLNRNMSAAKGGSKETTEAFGRLGISMADLKKSSPTDLLDMIAKKATDVGFAEKHASDMSKVMGRSYVGIVPMLKKGSEELAALRQEADDLGVVLSKETIDAGGVFQDTWKRIRTVITGLTYQIGGDLLPAANNIIKSTFDWIKANRAWLRASISSGLKTVSEYLGTVWQWTLRAVQVTERFVKAMGGMESPIMKTVVAIGALGAAIKFFGFPLTLAMLIADDLMVWIKGGKSITGDLFGSFEENRPAIKLWFADMKTGFAALKEDIGSWIADARTAIVDFIDLCTRAKAAWDRWTGNTATASDTPGSFMGPLPRSKAPGTKAATRPLGSYVDPEIIARQVAASAANKKTRDSFSEAERAVGAGMMAGRRGKAAAAPVTVTNNVEVNLNSGSDKEHLAAVKRTTKETFDISMEALTRNIEHEGSGVLER